MKIIATLIFFACFVLVQAGCNETASPPPQEQGPAPVEAPGPPSTDQLPATESDPVSEAKSTQAGPPEETSPPQKTTTEPPEETPPTEESEPAPAPSPDTNNELEEPALLDTLTRNCRFTQGSEDFERAGLAVGEIAVNFTLYDIDGREFRLSRLLAEKPVLMIFGSFT